MCIAVRAIVITTWVIRRPVEDRNRDRYWQTTDVKFDFRLRHAAKGNSKLRIVVTRLRGVASSRSRAATRTSSCELSYMNPSIKDDSKSNQEPQAFDLPPIHEEEVVQPAPDDDEKESAEKSELAQIEEDKAKTETVTKEAMLRVTGGQL
jgi:hypothetical protein